MWPRWVLFVYRCLEILVGCAAREQLDERNNARVEGKTSVNIQGLFAKMKIDLDPHVFLAS